MKKEMNEAEREKMRRDAALRRMRHDRKYMPDRTWMQGVILQFRNVCDFMPVRHLYQTPVYYGVRNFSFGGSEVRTLRYYGALPRE